jgi:hypothetical protein
LVAFFHGFDTGINALVAVGTLAAALLAVFQDWVRAQIMRPNFTLTLANPSLTQERNVAGAKAADAWYFGLNVHNGSPWAAKNCRVLLRALHRQRDDGERRIEPMTIPCPFTWSVLTADPRALTIGPRKSERADFLKIVRSSDVPPALTLEPVLAAYTFNFERNLSGGETAWYFVQIDADNLTSEECWVFRVTTGSSIHLTSST